MQLETAIEAGWPADTDWEALADAALATLLRLAPELANPRLCASLVFADDAQVHELTRDWREKNRPPNVLSFPMPSREALLALPREGPPELLGDVILSLETCAREAAAKSLTLQAHATHLIVHGLLHLAGHDHEISPEAARTMEALEIKTLALIGIADPYGDHEQGQGTA